MNSLTIQILVLLASFLFYRVLRSGFDSWTAVVIDFSAVIFLFGLQYFLQKNKNEFPSGPVSKFFGASFPDKISFEDNSNRASDHDHRSNQAILNSRLIYSMNPKENIYFESNQKMNLGLNIREIETPVSKIEVKKSGFYLLQCSVYCDKSTLNAKISLIGSKNQIDKSIHQGENSFVIQLSGPDTVQIELENGMHPTMILDQSSIYLVEL
jgi:hypothetical protein